MILDNFSVRSKLLLLLTSCLLGTFILQFYQLWEERNELVAERKETLHILVKGAVGLVAYFQRQSTVMGEERAKDSALKALQAYQFDEGKGYFWVTDRQPVMLMHAAKPDLNGQNMAEFAGPDGVKLFARFVEASQSEEPYVNYDWKPEGESQAQPKVAYVAEFAPWGWVVGSALYVHDIDAIFMRSVWRTLGMTLVVVAIIIVFARQIGLSITRPLERVVTYLKRVCDGDLSVAPAHTGRQDELGMLLRSCGALHESMRSLLENNQQGTEELSRAIGLLGEVTLKTSQGMNRQSDETTSLASAMEELSATIHQVADHANGTSTLTTTADEKINHGYHLMGQTEKTIHELAEDVEIASAVIRKLEQDTQQIDDILNVIRNISEQTNLLALNAAIEAARAGESGRGFAVVADEVRSLAKRTQDSTEEIRVMTEGLQAESSKAVAAMAQGKKLTESCVDFATRTGQSLQAARDIFSEVKDRNLQIAVTVEEQGAVANEVARNVTAIREVAVDTASHAGSLDQQTHTLRQLVSRTQALVSRYRL
ncbi:MAG: methyl-accepting chemotaxis protein [Hahellaceae bacterium]|nr:methyl-accepting chemotaxis protein [Hahellaceae bacterium]